MYYVHVAYWYLLCLLVLQNDLLQQRDNELKGLRAALKSLPEVHAQANAATAKVAE
jgi:hypothetical protein